jgi:lipopolysaccharide/colanic/teichoic acid biosynthesis glycosyltransferase
MAMTKEILHRSDPRQASPPGRARALPAQRRAATARGLPVPLVPEPGVGPGAARRALDIAVGLLGLTLAGLPLLAVLLAVRLTSPGPALFRQVRLGQGGRPFTLLKIRSMRTDHAGPEITVVGDSRVTRLGRFLRATSIDELPQLWHVLRGEMTLVGPRPETPTLAAGYPARCRWVFAYRPGLTGPAQVRLRDAEVLPPGMPVDVGAYLSRLVPARTAVEALFLSEPTLRATFQVLADTVRHLLGRPVPAR